MDFRSRFTPVRRKFRQNPTEAERIMWIYLRKFRGSGFIFRRQHSVDRYILDFYCPALKLGVEIDGGIHKEDDAKVKDEYRSSVLSTYGIRILRYKNEEVLEQAELVMQQIRQEIDKLTK